MFKQLKAIGKTYENYMVIKGRVEARKILLTQGESTLNDIGIDRAELEGGIKNWPWNGSATIAAKAAAVSKHDRKTIKKAVHELNTLSDRQLQDMGIYRGMIADAVVNGRPGIDSDVRPTRPQGSGDTRQAA